jgi:putative molybdopterin biosynthesis protein
MEIMSARDLSRYLKINEKKGYKLVQECKIPSMKIGGKVTFVKELIDKWMLENTDWGSKLLVAGTDDILLQNAVDSYNKLQEGMVYYAPVGSIEGLKALKDNRTVMACVAIPEGAGKENDLSYVHKYLDMDKYITVPLFLREQGIIVAKDNPKKIKSLEDIASKGATFVNRNPGSGTRLLLDYLLEKGKVDPTSIKGYETEVDSHLNVALKVLTGASDTGFGIGHLAHTLGLDHVSLVKEKFSVVISKERCHSQDVKKFLAFFEQPALSR